MYQPPDPKDKITSQKATDNRVAFKVYEKMIIELGCKFVKQGLGDFKFLVTYLMFVEMF